MYPGIPMEIVAIDGNLARYSAKGVERKVSLCLLPDSSVASNDFVMVHVGRAIEKMSASEARSA